MSFGLGLDLSFGFMRFSGSQGAEKSLSDVLSNIDSHPQDAGGWSILTPNLNTQFVYVSIADGDDATARPYTSGEIVDPYNPGTVLAYESLDTALDQLRDNMPDWILLKKGETFDLANVHDYTSGLSETAHKVYTAYGSGNVRPIIDSYDKGAIQVLRSEQFVTFKGIEFYPRGLDPNNIDFLGWGNITTRHTGFSVVSNTEEPAGHIHIEDCRFSYYGNNVSIYRTNETFDNIVFRRNEVLHALSEAAHSQGLGLSGCDNVLVEDNLLDHNGWYQQRPLEAPENTKDEGYATAFNHNAYLSGLSNFIFRNNLVSRASSIGLKLASNSYGATNEINFYDAFVMSNVFIEGEIGASVGGNGDQDDGYRWRNINFTNNVFVDIGKTQPTNRNIAWSLEVIDWLNGSVNGNMYAAQLDPSITNRRAIYVTGDNQGVQIINNKSVNMGITSEDYESTAATYLSITDTGNVYIPETGLDYVGSFLSENTSESSYSDYVATVASDLQTDASSYYDVSGLHDYLTDLINGTPEEPQASTFKTTFDAAQNQYVEIPELSASGDFRVDFTFQTDSEDSMSLFGTEKRLKVQVVGSGGGLYFLVGNSAGTSWQMLLLYSTPVNDGVEHEGSIRKEGNNYYIFMDDVEVASSTNVNAVSPIVNSIAFDTGGADYYSGALSKINFVSGWAQVGNTDGNPTYNLAESTNYLYALNTDGEFGAGEYINGKTAS